jgi:hypothetical protein
MVPIVALNLSRTTTPASAAPADVGRSLRRRCIEAPGSAAAEVTPIPHARSVFDTAAVRAVGGWPDAIGEDIVLTWSLLRRCWRTTHEPQALAFTSRWPDSSDSAGGGPAG